MAIVVDVNDHHDGWDCDSLYASRAVLGIHEVASSLLGDPGFFGSLLRWCNAVGQNLAVASGWI